MERIQTGIESLTKSSATEPWKMKFVSPNDGTTITAVLGEGGNVEVGPRLREVLSSIDRDKVYPRTVMGDELEDIGMTTRDSFIMKMMQGSPVHAEIGFRPYRRYRNPALPKIEGINKEIEDAEVVIASLEQSFSIMANEDESGGGGRIGDQIKNEKNKQIKGSSPLQEGARIEMTYEKSGSNQIDFMAANDDRFEDLFPNDLDHNVRIGDVMMVVPPLSIEVNRVGSIRKIKTLRSKSSMLIKGGSSATTITLQLYFHDLESINGYRVKMHKDKNRYYYLDGLRPLIAQFKKAPFVPIDNIYINETLGIDTVALVNLSVQTVPGFPHSLAVNLTLAKFDHSAYMPQVARLGDAINYPMLRWYYQEPLRDDISKEERSPYRTYLDPIPAEGLTNEFKFQIADGEDLANRKQLLQDLRNMTNPLIAEERFASPKTGGGDVGDGQDENTQWGREFKDGVMAQKVLDQHSRYKKLKNAGKISTKRDSIGYVPDSDKITITGYNDDKWEGVFREIYGAGKVDADVLKVSHYAPFESWIHSSESSFSEKQGGAFKLRLYAKNNVALFDKKYLEEDKDLSVLLVPGNEIATLQKIIQRGKKAETDYLKGIEDWKTTKASVEAMEGQIELIDYPINGTLIPTNVSVMYENQFSNIQLQALESPSFQFLGGQDPYIQVSFEADDLAVNSLKNLLETTEEYSRVYRTGITSGFLGVENHLLQLFGVETIMPETMQVRTVSGFPGRFQVDMTLCGFNKTQKRNEQLEGISPIYGDEAPSRESRKVGTVDVAADEAIIEMKLDKMELYPDLELPTYEELVSALPYINSGTDVYDNRTGAKYVDPDFYVATPVTYREIIRRESKVEHRMTMNDMMGVEMITSSQGVNPIEGEAAMWELLNAVDARTQQISANFSWSGSPASEDGGTSNSEGITFKDSTVEAYVKDRKKIKEPPPFELWKSWGLGNDPRAYEHWKSKKVNPQEWEVYNKIYELVDKLWVGQGLVYNDKKANETSKSWQSITYASQEDMWDLEWNRLAKKDPKMVKDGSKEVHKLDKVKDSDYKNTKSKVTRERIANIIKAILEIRSNWKQINASGIPIIDSMSNAAGVAGVPLSSEAANVETAKRLLWDWEYNMEFGINQLFLSYKAALEKKELEYKCRPWEWMVTAYATGTIEGEMRNAFWQQVSSLFNAKYNDYAQLYGTPSSPLNMTVMQQRNGYSSTEMDILRGDKSALIEDLLSSGYLMDKPGWGSYTKKETKKRLEEMSDAKVREVYEKHNEGYETSDARKEQAKAVSARNPEKSVNPKGLSDGYGAYADTKDFIDNNENSRLVNQSSPQDVFPEMFTDMIEYDHRMRLVRAFPTFQMFIVDEGKWMTNYRLWDNLYGFNAIQSIDIHKSRKIAADTAVISMTNIYSNLTSRSLDTTYEEFDYKFWDNLVWGNPNDKILEARKELLNSLLLQTGARIHLRLGYGSSASNLPVVFNGTITEINADEMVEIVAQGDGVELGNVISGDPGDDNKGFFKITEPRDLLCELLTSKGNWLKDVMNYTTDGGLFKENPLGIQHFGQPGEAVPEGTWKFFNTNYGEAAQNIYSSNGTPTFSQWTTPDGEDIPFSFDTPMLKWLQPGDEQNIAVPFYNNTVWDVAQTLAYCSMDYIAAVHPYEMRSTLFFGKPYWSMAYKYDSTYDYNEEQKSWIRTRNVEHRKPYTQFHSFDSYSDIIGNSIKASEEGVYTNVIVNYDGKQVGPIYADFDIRFDKQKTTVIDAQIVSRVSGLDFWTSEKQALYYGVSAVRDYMKDMYKGELIVMGDPTIKPHDICYMNDVMYDMNGNFQVKAVTHQFSHETGFITSVQPDVMAISDDMALLSVSNWGAALLVKTVAEVAGFFFGATAVKRMIPSAVRGKAMRLGKAGAVKGTQMAIQNMMKFLPDNDVDVKKFKKLVEDLQKLETTDPKRAAIIEKMKASTKKIESKLDKWDKKGMFTNSEGVKKSGKGSYARMKRTVSIVKTTTESLSDGAKAYKYVKYAAMATFGLNPLSLLAAAVTTWMVETIAEKYRRKKAMMQCVLISPLMYQGREYTAGINGHRGMVVGDAKVSKIDGFLQGAGLDGVDGEGGFTDMEWAMDTWNFLTDANGKDYNISEEEIRNGFKNE